MIDVMMRTIGEDSTSSRVGCRNAIEENPARITEFVLVGEGLYERDRGAYEVRRGCASAVTTIVAALTG